MKKILVVIAVVWVAAFVFPLPSQATHSFKDGVCIPFMYATDYYLKFYGVYLVFWEYAAPVPIFIYCYARMYLTLRSAKIGSANKTTQKASKNLFKTLIIVVFVFILCWTWTQISLLGFCFGFDADMTTVRYNISVALSLLNCCINPMIYMANWKKFQSEIFRLMPCMRSKIGVESSTQDSSVVTTNATLSIIEPKDKPGTEDDGDC